jgi:iron complex transport system substrate-binding protein
MIPVRVLCQYPVLLCLLLSWSTSTPAETVLPRDDANLLKLPSPASRIVSLAPNLTELAFAAGAGQQLVATVEYSDYPPAASQLPRVGDAFRFDLEHIVSLKPDLILAWASGNPEVALQQLESFGLNVWRTEVREPGDIATLLEAIGDAAGTADTASAAAARFRNRLAKLESHNVAATPVRYFYQVAARPLFTVGGHHLISRGLSVCGGENLFVELGSLAPQVSIEAVLAGNPEALIAPRLDDGPDPLAEWRQWPRLTAVQNDALLYLPADAISRATPRFLDAIEIACTLLNDLRIEQTSTGRKP